MAKARKPQSEAPAPLAEAGRPLSWLHRAVLLAVLALVVLLATRQVGSLDVGFHLRAGESILSGGGFPAKDTLTYTLGDRDYVDTSWLFQVLLALAHRALGVHGLTLFVVAAVLGTFTLLWRTARLLPVDPTTLSVVLLLGALAAEMRFAPRPEVLSWLLLAAVLHVLHRHAEGLRSPLWLLPVLMLVWANAHALFALGLVAIGSFAAGLLLRDRKLDRAFLACLAASCVAPLLNPYGLRGALFPLELMSRMKPGNPFAESIGEFVSPFDLGLTKTMPFVPEGPLLAFRVLAALAILALAVMLFRRRWWSVLLGIAVLWLTWKMIRNMPLLPVALAPVIAWALPLERLLSRAGLADGTRRIATRAALSLAALATVLIGLRVAHDAWYVASRRMERTGFGWNALELPVAAADHARSVGLPPPVLNHLNFGGYLGWALREPVFIDGRLEVVGEEFYRYYREAFASDDGLEGLAERWKPGWLVFPYSTAPRLLGRVSRDPRWTLTHVDALAVVFARAGAAPHVPPARLEYAPERKGDLERVAGLFGNPRRSSAARWWDGVLRRQAFPVEDHYLGLFHYWRGETEAARARWVRALLATDGRYHELYANLGAVLLRQGDVDTARRCYAIVLEDDPRNRLAREKLEEIARRPGTR